MLQEVTPLPVPGLVNLNSVQGLRLYLKELLSHYERQCDIYGEKVGLLMRELDAKSRGKDLRNLQDVQWKKIGMLLVNTNQPVRGTLELMIEAMEEYKAKATRTKEVLMTVDQLEDLGIPADSSMILYMRHGVPMRMVIDEKKSVVGPCAPSS